MTKPDQSIEASLEFDESEDNTQQLLAAFDMLFAGIDIYLPDDPHLTEN